MKIIASLIIICILCVITALQQLQKDKKHSQQQKISITYPNKETIKHTNLNYDVILSDLFEKHKLLFFKDDNSFIKPIEYALQGGKRIRPKIALDICNSVSNGNRSCGLSSLSIEYIHVSSLIIDDLPCMDNAKLRRNKECLHIKFNEAISQLTSVMLMSMALNAISYDLHNRCIEGELTFEESHKIGMFFLDNFSNTIGYNGASGGQLIDLEASGKVNENVGELLKETSLSLSVETIIRKKTGTFFETSFLLGWLIGGGTFEKIDAIKKVANDFAMVFQITDDLEDLEEDKNSNTKNISQNYALRYNEEKAIADAKEYLKVFKQEMKLLNLYSPFIKDLCKLMEKRINLKIS
jgi:geranylgeranyl pyrophosphate synthase